MSAEVARDPYMTCDMADALTVASILRRRAQRGPDRLAYAFLSDAGRTEERLTYGELDRRARSCAAALRRAGAGDGQRALLLFPPGVDFVVAFFGCLYAGTVAVPAYPPDPFRLDRTLPRLAAIVDDATPVVALTTAQLLGYTGEIASRAAGLAALRWIAVDEVPDEPAGVDTGADGAPPTGPALLQYTSGSTGDPKGVVLSDANLLHNLGQIRGFFRATDETRGLIWLPPYHDMGLIGGLLQPLHGGFPVWLMSPLEFLSNPLSWLQAISRVGATMSGGPNFAYDLCVRRTTPQQRAALDLSSWQVAFNGAEPVRPETMARFAEAFAPSGFDAAAFLPCYGLAEATLIVTGGGPVSTAGHVDPAALERGEVLPDPATPRPLASCGSSAPDQRVLIVDPHTRLPCPAGRVGEVWVAGPSVAHGYWRKPDETRATFGATIAGTGDGPFLRTGDLGFLRDAELVVTGRLIDLLIIRGRNHYPHDIELTAERAHPAVRPGCSAAFLVADELVLVHEVARGSEGIDIGTVAAAVRAAVAQEHDVRVGSVVLLAAGAMPKTSSGKVRRRDCREQLQAGELAELARTAGPERGAGAVVLTRDVLLAAAPPQRRELLVEYLLDRTALVCGAAAEADRPLVATGLDSLAAQQLGQLVDDELGTAVPLGEILGGATAHDIADRLATGLTATPPELPLAPAAPDGTAPDGALTHGQRSLWFLDRLGNGGTAYTTVAAVQLRGLDGPALAAAFDAVVARHGALRTTFSVRDGEPRRVVHERALPGAYTEIDATALPPAQLAARLEEDANTPFHLASGPLARLCRYRCTDADGAGYDVVVLAAHHIVTDVRSMRIVVRDLAACYDDARLGRPSGGPDGPTYQDVVVWEHQLLAGPERARLERYWDEQLRGGDAALRLPRRRAGSPSSRAGTHSFRIGAELTARIRERAATEGVTLNMVLLAALQTLLHSLTGQEELAVGTPVAARTRRDLDDVAGYCMNPVVVRSHAPRTDSFRQLLLRTRAQVAGAVAHQAYPAALLAQRHAAFRHGGLYRAMFVFNQPTPAELAEPGAAMLGYAGIRRSFGPHQVESVPIARRDCAEDVELTMSEIDGVVHATLLFRLDVLDADAAALFARRLTAVLDAVATDPGLRLGSLPRADAEERERVLRTWSTAGVRGAAPTGRVDDLVAERARSAPRVPAVVAGTEEWTYAQLDEHANRLARHLLAAGVGAGQRVGLCLERSPQLIAAMLGVLRTGAAYVPVDPANPRDRIAAVLADAEVTAVVSQDVLTGKLPGLGVPLVLTDADLTDADLTDADLTDVDGEAIARRPGTPPSPPAGPDSCAYVIYTSGSTGTPKGVEVRHGGLANYVAAFVRDCAVGPADRVLQFSSAGFDASAEEIYGALTSGAALVLRTDAMLASPEAFLGACGELGITVLCVATSYWHELMVGVAAGTARVPECVRLVVIGGEKALPEHVATWREHVGARVRLHNTYGPTEATIVAASWDVTAADGPGPVPIGRPVAGARIYLLDADLEPVPPGVVGEMYIGGAGVAQGYRGRPSLTAERFVADPFGAEGDRPDADRTGGGRLYRTGDRARHLPDGTLVFVDRADRQVKIAGHRIELGEIESALRALPGVADAVVARRDGGLAAYVIPADGAPGGAPVDEQELRTALRAALPAYMVPARYAVVPGFPRTPNGKLDIAALPEPALPTAEGPADPPRTPEERTLAGIWADVLGVPVVHRGADFFALGGHSLLATKVLARVGELMGRELPLRVVFESPTLAGLAQRLADTPPAAVAPIPRTSRGEQVPLAFVQEQIWFLEQFDPGSANYNVPRSLRVHGAVDPEVVAAVFADLEVRHEILRTTFPDVDGVPVQLVHPPRGIPVPVIDSSAFAAEHDANEVVQHVRDIILERGREPFDLAAGPLLRVALVRLAADDHVLVVVEHHLLHDGWAQGVFLRDFLALFAARTGGPPARLPELPIQYADFAAWQRRTLRDGRLRDLLGYWVAQLDGAPGMLGLPTDRPRTEVRTQRGAEERLAIDAELAQRLGAFGRAHGASPFMTMFAAFSALMSGYTGKDDLVLGTGIANRQRPELENLLGMMINTVVLRADVAGEPSFLTLLERTRRTCLQAYAHQELPFSVLVDRLRPDRDTSHMPVIQVMFSFLDTPLPPMEVPGLRFEVIEVHNRTAKFDMNVVVMVPPEYRGSAGAESVSPSGQGITVLAEYNTDLFDAATIRLMFERYETLLRAVLANPGRPVTEHLRGIGLDALPLGTS